MHEYCIVCGDKLPEDCELSDPCAWFDDHRVAHTPDHTGLFCCSDSCLDEWRAKPEESRHELIKDLGGTI